MQGFALVDKLRKMHTRKERQVGIGSHVKSGTQHPPDSIVCMKGQPCVCLDSLVVYIVS